MREPFAERLGKPDDLRNAAAHQHVHVERHAAFELGELEQAFHQQRRIDRARARLEHEAHVLRRLVAHVGEERQLLLVDQFGDALDQPHFLHLPGNFGDHDLIGAAAGILGLPARAHAERAAAGRIGLGNGLGRIDDEAAGREIRSGHVFEQRLGSRVGLLDEMQRGVAQFGDVVRRNRRRHADRDALRAVGQQIGERRRQDHRLLRNAVVVRPEIDGVFVDAVEQKPRDFGQARFGVAIGRGVIAVDIAEIALAVDQRIARGKILREPHQRVIDRLIAVRMEIAHHVADDLCRFLECRAGIEAQQPHAVENAPVHRLEPVARIRQRAMHDGGERVSEIALLERLAQRDFLDPARIGGNHFLVHGGQALARLCGREQGMNGAKAAVHNAGTGGSGLAHGRQRGRNARAPPAAGGRAARKRGDREKIR